MWCAMSDVGSKVIGIMVVCVGGIILFAPLASVLVAAASKGRGRVLAWAFAGSFAAALG